MSTTQPAAESFPGDPDFDAAPLTNNRLLARNAVWNLATQCVPMAVALVTMPWMIRGLGNDRFGVMTLSWMVLGYFSLFDLGLGRALTKLVAEMLGRGRNDEVAGLVWTALALMTGLGLVGTVFVAAITPLMVDLLKVAEPLKPESRGAFYLMAAALPFLIGTAGLRGVMEAHQRFKGINVVRTATSLFLQLAPLAMLPLTHNLVAVVGVVALGRLVSWAAHMVICFRTIPELRRGISFRADLIAPLVTFGGWMTAVNVINPLMVQMDRFLIGALVSAAAVTFYATPYELVTKAWFLSNAVLGVMFPAFATSYVVDRARTAEIFGRCLKHVALILFPVALGAVALGHEVLTVWLGADFAEQSTRVLQWLAVGVLLCGLAQVPSAMIQGIGRPDLTFKLHLAELPPYLLAAWLLIAGPASGGIAGRWMTGIEGAAIAWTARTALDLVLYMVTARWVLPEGSAVFRGLARGVVAALVALGVAALPLGLYYRATAFLALSGVFAVAAWARLLDADERGAILARLGVARGRLVPAGVDVGMTGTGVKER